MSLGLALAITAAFIDGHTPLAFSASFSRHPASQITFSQKMTHCQIFQ